MRSLRLGIGAMALTLIAGLLLAGHALCVHVDLQGSEVVGQARTWNGADYWAFLGIRYGTPPIKAMRFKPPTLATLPSQVDATEYGHHCHPVVGVDEKADEDCLFINVFCPPVGHHTGKKLAVLVFIHGGGNIYGNPDFADGGALTTENNIILVTFNYRLGPLGFLSLRNDHSDGNYGLLDQRLALEWTNRFIHIFGGDPQRITLAGVSAGGKDTSVHTVSAGSRGLFQRAIMLSGTILGPSLYPWDHIEAARRLAERVNCSRENVAEIESCLQQVPAALLSAKAFNLWPDHPMRTVLDFGWGAVRDGTIVPTHRVPGMFEGQVLVGVNNNEGSLFLDGKLPLLNETSPGFAQTVLEETSFKCNFIKEALFQYYLKVPAMKAIQDTYNTYALDHGCVGMRGAMDFYADQQYVAPALGYLNLGISTKNSYLYYFDHYLARNEHGELLLKGAHHVDDQNFVLGLTSDENQYSDKERLLSKGMRIYISNFVKTGDPNLPVKPGIAFHNFNNKDYPQSFLHVTGNSHRTDDPSMFGVKSCLLPHRMALWSDRLPVLMQENGTDEACNV